MARLNFFGATTNIPSSGGDFTAGRASVTPVVVTPISPVDIVRGTEWELEDQHQAYRKLEELRKLDTEYNKRLGSPPQNQTEVEISTVCDEMKKLLIDKNRAYGNSALAPSRIFAKSDNVEQLKVRIDDKLNRVMKGTDYQGEDTVDDLIGYLILLKVALRDNWK